MPTRKEAHPPKFDHELARQLYKVGFSLSALGRRFGVHRNSIRRVVVPGWQEYATSYQRQWARRAVCPVCGGPMTQPSSLKNKMCKPCRNKAMVLNVRDDTLKCEKCRLWKPDDQFNRNRRYHWRRGRQIVCRDCEKDERFEQRLLKRGGG